jgi:O-antigen/teichoic acid export membrane protein
MWRRIARDSIVLGGSALLMAALQVAFRLLAVHALSVSAYGRVGLLIGVFNFAAIFGTFSVPIAAARLAAQSEGLASGLRVMSITLRASAIPSLASSIGFAAVVFAVTGSSSLAALSALGVVPMVVSIVLAGFLRGKGNVVQAAVVQPVNTLAQLLALLLVVMSHSTTTAGWVLGSFYLGNLAAFAVAAVFIRGWIAGSHGTPVDPPRDGTARDVIRFSTWLTVSNLALIGLTVTPRAVLARLSYQDVAYLDLGLLIYSIPQRLTSSLVLALVPVVARREARGGPVSAPAIGDFLAITGALFAVDALVWQTHLLPAALRAAGLARYSGAENVLLIVLLGAPAELFFSVNSGLLQATGRSRRLASLTAPVLLASLVLASVLAPLGATWLAGLLALDYWVLYGLSLRYAGLRVARTSLLSALLAGPRPRQLPARG